MLYWIRRTLAPPIFDDEDKTRAAGLLNIILLVCLVAAILIFLIQFIADGSTGPVIPIMFVVMLGLQILMRRGYVDIASIAISLTILAGVVYSNWTMGGIRYEASTGYFLIIAIAGLLLGGRAALVFTVISIISIAALSVAEIDGAIPSLRPDLDIAYPLIFSLVLSVSALLLNYAVASINSALKRARSNERALAERTAEAEKTAEEIQRLNAQLQHEIEEREHLKQQIIEAQQQMIQELSSPIIPVMEGIIVMPLVGSIDTNRARDITRAVLSGITEHRARAVILDITGVSVIDTGIADHLNKTIQAVRLKGAHTIITGMSDAVAETIVDLGIDWSKIETLRNLQSGLLSAMNRLNIQLDR